MKQNLHLLRTEGPCISDFLGECCCSEDTFCHLFSCDIQFSCFLVMFRYHKKTDDKMYLHYSSTHPRSQKDAIPYSLFIRCKRICTENRHFNMEVQEITNKLAHHGYPKDLIVKSFLKAKNQGRDNLLKMDEIPNNQENKIRLITTYNKHNPPMKEILERDTRTTPYKTGKE